MKKRNLIIANWKMNPESLAQAKNIFNSARLSVKSLKNTDVVVCPPFPFIQPLIKLNHPKNLFLGSQNVAEKIKGAFTGEVSVSMVKDMGVTHSIIGHSERLAMGETAEIVKRKLEMALDNDLIPILCIGEKERDKDGAYLTAIKNQIKSYLHDLPKKHLVGLIVAYEPIWVIGKSYKEAMSPTDIHETVLFIRKVVGESFGRDIAAGIKILYGGSVEVENVLPIVEYGNVDGFLVGHASLVPEQFSKILKAADIKR